VQLMCTQYVYTVNPGCDTGDPECVGKTCESSEAVNWKECKGDGNGTSLCGGHVCSVHYSWYML